MKTRRQRRKRLKHLVSKLSRAIVRFTASHGRENLNVQTMVNLRAVLRDELADNQESLARESLQQGHG